MAEYLMSFSGEDNEILVHNPKWETVDLNDVYIDLSDVKIDTFTEQELRDLLGVEEVTT